jgi:hypothetical protein
MSKKFGFGCKLAVAALAVAGVVGTAVAAPPTTGKTASADMTATFKIETLAEIEATAYAGLTNAVLLATNAATSTSTIAGNTFGQAPGTLGTIMVRTNANNWDVQLRTNNGGGLMDITKSVLVPGTCATYDAWGQCQTYNPDTYSDAPYLIYNTTGNSDAAGVINGTTSGPDTVQLEVAVGMARTGASLGSPAALANELFALGGPGDPAAPVLIPFNNLKASKVNTTPVSLATLIAGTTAYTGATGVPAGIPTATNRLWADIATNGFTVPDYPLDAAHQDEEYFFINVGINQALKGTIGGNDEGEYSEVFTFTLVASF